MKYIISLLLLTCMMTGCDSKTQEFKNAVRFSVERQLETYPESTLKDLYKSFFQDRFGPGHIIADTTAAGRYLRWELNSMTDFAGLLVEPLGWQNNYVRVSLITLKLELVPYNDYFDAFVRSVNGIHPPTIDEWRLEWSQIEALIRKDHSDLPGYEADRIEIEQRLEQGEYVGHHSEAYEKAYSPHYRIISRDIYEKELRSMIEE